MFGISKVEALKSKSNNIMNVFTKTIGDLKSVNEEIGVDFDRRATRISELNKENEDLGKQSSANQKMIDKLENLISL